MNETEIVNSSGKLQINTDKTCAIFSPSLN